VIIWLNGTFGAGKTTTAAELVTLIPDSRLFDPEDVGYMLRSNLADRWPGDFQHWPAWRSLVFHVLLDVQEPVLRNRIEASGEAVEWRLEHLAEYQAARPWLLDAADLVVDTTALSAAHAAQSVAGALDRAQAGTQISASGRST
jgi:hypothetical protein